MTEIFADGTGSIIVSNGVVRIELVQLRRKGGKAELSSQSAGTLLMPVGSLKNLTLQLAKALEQLQERQADKDRLDSEMKKGDELDEALRSEEHTSELQSLMRISYAVFCLKKKKTQTIQIHITHKHRQKINKLPTPIHNS